MENSNDLKKLAGIVILLLVLLGAAYLIWFKGQEKPKDPGVVGQIERKTNFPNDVLPNKFPSDLPLEDGAEITENSIIVLEDGREQATRTFESTRSMQANFNTYRSYMVNNGWEIRGETNTDDYKTVYGKKGFQKLQVTINDNELADTVTVLITLTEG